MQLKFFQSSEAKPPPPSAGSASAADLYHLPTLTTIFRLFDVTFHTKNQARELTSKKHACVGHRGDQKAKCEQTWLPKRLQNQAQNHQKSCSWRLRVKKVNLVKTSVFAVSNTHPAHSRDSRFLKKLAREASQNTSRENCLANRVR